MPRNKLKMDSCDEMFVRNNIEVKVRARNISLQSEVGNSVAKMLLLIMILPTNDWSKKMVQFQWGHTRWPLAGENFLAKEREEYWMEKNCYDIAYNYLC